MWNVVLHATVIRIPIDLGSRDATYLLLLILKNIFLCLVWYGAWSFEPQKWLRYRSESAQNFHYQILALGLGGGYQNENSQIDFWAESETKGSGSMNPLSENASLISFDSDFRVVLKFETLSSVNYVASFNLDAI